MPRKRLYKFFSGFEPWFGGNRSAESRAGHLIFNGFVNNFYNDDVKAQLVSDAHDMADFNTANSYGWTTGKVGNKPWQWYGPFIPQIHPGESPKISLSVDLTKYGDPDKVTWFFTANENDNWNKAYWVQK